MLNKDHILRGLHRIDAKAKENGVIFGLSVLAVPPLRWRSISGALRVMQMPSCMGHQTLSDLL